MQKTYIITLLFIASSCSASAHLLLKKISEFGWVGIISWHGLAAMSFYGLGFLLYFYSLKHIPVSIACQFTAVTYVLICLGAVLIFKETVTVKQIIGMSGIFIGFILVLG